MANIRPRDGNQLPKIGDSFKVGSECLVSGLYKHACGIGQTPFQKGEKFPPHIIDSKQNNVTAMYCEDQYGVWKLHILTE